MYIQDKDIYWLVSKFPPGSIFRSLGKRIFKDCTIKQSFYNGIICLDAVEHAWAWLGRVRYETFDIKLQEGLLSLSYNYDLMIDIGCNIGAMALSVLLRNPKIKVVCIEPNQRAISLLKKSVSLNHLTERISIIEAAVSNRDGALIFNGNGSVMGHVSNLGRQVKGIDFVSIVNQYSSNTKCLVKVDVEGFESILMRQLFELRYLKSLCLVVELHPLRFNQFGDPDYCLKMLLESGALVEDLQGKILDHVEGNNVTQVIASWSYA